MIEANEHDETVKEIVIAYLQNNPVSVEQIFTLIQTVREAFCAAEVIPDLIPFVPVEQSVTDDYIICLEDGKKFKSLKRHIKGVFNLTPEEYRTKWKLPVDYPMTAPNYSKVRRQLALDSGLGKV